MKTKQEEEEIDMRKRAEVDRMWTEFIDDGAYGEITLKFKNGRMYKLTSTRDEFYCE